MIDTEAWPEEQEYTGEDRSAKVAAPDLAKASEHIADTPDRFSPPREWTMAALAHASTLLTFFFAFAGGIGALVGLVVPLVIYVSYRERSPFIAFHALQSLAYQGAGILAYLVLVAVSGATAAVAWTISGLLSAVIIGLLLMPLALIVTILMIILLVGAPLLWVAYGLYAAYRVYQGEDFRYLLVGRWLQSEVKT